MEIKSCLSPDDLHFLENNLPFTLNALNSLTYYPDRTKVYYSKTQRETIYVIEFKSGYNKHIWYSPIIWMISDNADINFLRNSLREQMNNNSSFIALARSFSENPEVSGILSYREKLMVNDKFDGLIIPEFKVVRLDEFAAEQSLLLSLPSKKGKFTNEEISRERLFIRERETYGIFLDNKLVCRGSIMAGYGKYFSVGGFITHTDYRKMGLATSLVGFICKRIMEMGGIATLTVRKDNMGALSLYRKLGFMDKEEIMFLDCGSGVVP
jgi:GNAT superfamily N-acetyltransferase